MKKNTEKIKVCHIANTDMGVKFLLIPQLQFLMGHGYDVHVVCSPGNLTEEIRREGIQLTTLPMTRKITPFADIISLIKLYVYFKKEKFDIVHTHAPKPGLLGQVAAKLAGVPIIINTVHGLYVTEDSPLPKKIFFRLMDTIAARCSMLIFSQNREDMATMEKEGIAHHHELAYLGNGINVETFDPTRFDGAFIQRKKEALGISQAKKIVGIVARLVREKGYQELFEAFHSVLAQYPDALLLAIGPVEPEKKDGFGPDIVKKYGLEKNVIFLGERKDVDELYPLMDVFVLPSWREGFPRSVIEAMAMEKAIVVTDIRGCREEIDHNKNGLLIPPKDPKALAAAIIRLLGDKEYAAQLAKNARQKAVTDFDEKLVFDRIQEQYQRLAQKYL